MKKAAPQYKGRMEGDTLEMARPGEDFRLHRASESAVRPCNYRALSTNWDNINWHREKTTPTPQNN